MAIKIYIDPGHGGSDLGAVGYVKEQAVAVKVSEAMAPYLRKHYYCEVKMSRGSQNTHQRAEEANAWGADLFVSIHFNAGGGDGYEALVYNKSSLKLGQTFEKYVKAVGQNSRGIKYDPTLNVLRLTDMEAILNEIAFVDNKKDISDWNEDHELKVMGEALAKAAAAYTGAKKKETAMKVKLKQQMNRRTGPGMSYKRLGTRNKGRTLTLYEVSRDGKWGYVKDDYPGWICITSKYVTKV